MADEKNESKKPDPKESGEKKGEDGKMDQILALLTQVLEKIGGGEASPKGEPAPDAGAAPSSDGQMSDEEYNQMLQEIMGKGAGEPGAESRAGEKPVPNSTYPNGQAGTVVPLMGEDKAKLSRLEQELIDQKAEVTRMKVREALVKLNRPDIANPEDAVLVEDLIAMPPEARQRQFDRFAKTPAAPGSGGVHLSRALDGAVPNTGAGKKRITTREEMVRLQRKATEQRTSFEAVATAEGYDLS